MLLATLAHPNIRLVEDDKILNEDEKIVEELISFFQNAVSNLNIQENSFIQSKDYHSLSDPVQRAIAERFINLKQDIQ